MTNDGTPETSGVKFPPPLMYAGAIVVGVLVQRVEPVHLVSAAYLPAVHVAAAIVCALGALLSVTALRVFRKAGTSPIPIKPTTALVFDGPYRVTRNPMYLSLTLVTLAIALWLNMAWIAVALIVVVFLIDRAVIAREERYLEQKFGEPYIAYKARVRRWL